MTGPIAATYQDGVLKLAAPLDLPDGTVVRIVVTSDTPPPTVTHAPPSAPHVPPRTAADVLARILASAAKFRPDTDRPEVTSANVDAVLYGPGGAR